MSKIIDITDKLDFEENPRLKVKDIELEVDASAENLLKVMGLATDEPTAKDVLEMCEIIFTKESKYRLELPTETATELQRMLNEYAKFIGKSSLAVAHTHEHWREL